MAYRAELIDSKRLWCGHYPCGNTQSPDGTVVVNGGDRRGNITLISTDKGDTWEYARNLHVPGMTRLADGTYFAQDFQSVARFQFNPKVQKKIPYIMKKYRADSFDDIMAGNIQIEFECVDIPDLAVGYGDDQDPNHWFAGCAGTGAIQLECGDIMLPMYGQFKQDESKLSYFENYDFRQYRTWVLISHDNGHTFEYLSTVADCQTYPWNPEAEGFCEPELLYLGGEHIICALRTQGHEVYTPLYISHSYDSGKTWETPVEINPFGVLPRLLKMQNGAIICASGKWDTFFQISGDDGVTWSDRVIVAENDGQWDRGPSGYVSIFETNPNELLIVYDHTEDRVSDFAPDKDRRIIYANRYRIVRE
ncbi:MAG: exo-alpha-sialidase [Clostridia bacterium]|nr:exo-alpha-sialidase [Clostridia bacterium]